MKELSGSGCGIQISGFGCRVLGSGFRVCVMCRCGAEALGPRPCGYEVTAASGTVGMVRSRAASIFTAPHTGLDHLGMQACRQSLGSLSGGCVRFICMVSVGRRRASPV